VFPAGNTPTLNRQSNTFLIRSSLNAFASYQATDNFKVDFSADNLFDVKYANPLNASTTSVVYEPGITLKLAATMRFGG